MQKNERNSGHKVTGEKAATAASKVLQNQQSSKDAKTAAGSALSQREKKG